MNIEQARQLAAQIWTEPEFENVEMDAWLCEAFAKALQREVHAVKVRLDAIREIVTDVEVNDTDTVNSIHAIFAAMLVNGNLRPCGIPPSVLRQLSDKNGEKITVQVRGDNPRS